MECTGLSLGFALMTKNGATTMNNAIRSLVTLAFVCGLAADSFAKEQAADSVGRSLRIGAVAYSPSTVTVFQGLTRYLNSNGLAADYVLYSSYDALVDALDREEIEIAWNTPLAHARYHVKRGCSSQTLVMRDVDFNVHSVVVARTDAGIRSLADLAGRRLILGSSQAAEATVLPLHFLRKVGVDLDQIRMVSLEREVDNEGNPCASPQHVLQALRDGRGDAGIITEDLWQGIKSESIASNSLQCIWTSPGFSHCVFTASKSFDKALGAQFTKLMTKMKPDDPATRDVMGMEGTKKWLPGSSEGFEALIEALR